MGCFWQFPKKKSIEFWYELLAIVHEKMEILCSISSKNFEITDLMSECISCKRSSMETGEFKPTSTRFWMLNQMKPQNLEQKS